MGTAEPKVGGNSAMGKQPNQGEEKYSLLLPGETLA